MDRSRALDHDEMEKFIGSLTEYQPALPDALVRYYLSRAGFATDDVRIERLVALAAQKFLADVANDAIANSRLRADAAPAPHGARAKAAARDPKITLTVDDLERALREYGVNLRKPPYFADSVTAGVPQPDPAAAAGAPAAAATTPSKPAKPSAAIPAVPADGPAPAPPQPPGGLSK
jgi:transcription initiation factor TFIID subunit 10